ncbi:MAG: hypothetical protein MUF13_02565 [Akkermansiaceae bacterium]|jgi:hypothetical protein|nr:hypothetical protein [Akkermansiaceae bacterium]
MSRRKLTREQRDEITRRVLSGESQRKLSEEFSVTPQCVSLLKIHAENPEVYSEFLQRRRTRKLMDTEKEQFLHILATSTPEKQGLIPAREKWSLEHGRQLIERLFNKKASPASLKKMMEPFIPKRSEFKFSKPQPPKKHHINQLDPELAKDEDYVNYYLSPICEQIAWREYEAALADWEERFAHEEDEDGVQSTKPAEAAAPAAPAAAPMDLIPRLRVGKHAKSKGSPFTPAKRKKKRR